MLHSNCLRQLDLQDILVFLNLFELHSARRTAELMNISQPTVSYCLKRLRDCFGDALFVPLHGALLPTTKSEKIAPYLHVVVESVNQCAGEEISLPVVNTKVWQICAPEYFELTLLPQILQALAKKDSLISLRLERLGRDLPVNQLISGHIDIATGFGSGYNQRHPELAWQSILDDDFVCLTSYIHTSPGSMITLDEFCASPHVFPTPWLSEGNMVDSWLDKIGRTRAILVRVNGYQASVNIIATVPATLALPARLLPLLRIPENVVVCKPPMGFPVFTLDMCWAKTRGNDPDIITLRKLIDNAAKALLGK